MSQTQHSAPETAEHEGSKPEPLSRMVLMVPSQLRWALKARAARQQITMQRLVVQILEADVAREAAGLMQGVCR